MGKKHKKRKAQQREAYHKQGYNMQNISSYHWNCHNGPVGVFDIGESKIYAGSQWEIDCSPIKFDVFICANGGKGKFVSAIQLEDKRGLLKATNEEIIERLTPTFLTLDIMDGGVPAVGPRFWKSLVADLRDKHLSVAVYCQGGHGRTGLVLTCLAWYGGMVRQHADIVQFVRHCYCREAVETVAQFNYLKQMGMTTTALPSFKPVVIAPKIDMSHIQYGGTTTANSTVPVTVQEGSQGVIATVTTNDNQKSNYVDFTGPEIDEWLAERREGETIEAYYLRTAENSVASADEIREWEKTMIQEQEQKDEAKRLGPDNDYAG